MSKYIDLTNQIFHRLTAICRVFNDGYHTMWQCVCDCENMSVVRAQHLRNGNTKSCGCWDADVLKTRSTKHGLYNSPEYQSWKAMIQRCYNPKNRCAHLYGGRGITVEKQWHEFAVFYKDMAPRPLGKTLDRKNNDLNYSKNNCRWATAKEQRANQRPKGK